MENTLTDEKGAPGVYFKEVCVPLKLDVDLGVQIHMSGAEHLSQRASDPNKIWKSPLCALCGSKVSYQRLLNQAKKTVPADLAKHNSFVLI